MQLVSSVAAASWRRAWRAGVRAVGGPGRCSSRAAAVPGAIRVEAGKSLGVKPATECPTTTAEFGWATASGRRRSARPRLARCDEHSTPVCPPPVCRGDRIAPPCDRARSATVSRQCSCRPPARCTTQPDRCSRRCGPGPDIHPPRRRHDRSRHHARARAVRTATKDQPAGDRDQLDAARFPTSAAPMPVALSMATATVVHTDVAINAASRKSPTRRPGALAEIDRRKANNETIAAALRRRC